ncbi:MAG: polynucleotide adenylyltransferase PcnB [Porticoccaceae bacterium]|nr:polynucleotide adenylyltransferase PcnB [Porticoccaceae bacterium]
MLERINKFFRQKTIRGKAASGDVVASDEHTLTPEMMSVDALKVVRTLQKAGFQAYVVGGCVRDLLLGLKPKDFDVATNAEPDQVKSLFRRARIIGRRFQIVHVQFNREIIEVTTFRSNQQGKNSNGTRRQTDSGMLTRDNVFGTLSDDASRRDLTINALYYDPIDNSLRDFADGLNDIKKRVVRIMGDPATRFREDPVRLLRVVRFAAKLGFRIESKTAEPMRRLADNLQLVSAPRFFDESLKLFMSGQGLATYQLLDDYRFFDYIVPELSSCLQQDPLAAALIEQAFTNTDLRIRSLKRVTPAFIYAALLWPIVAQRATEYREQGESPLSAQRRAADNAIFSQVVVTAIPKRFSIPMREIWDLQLSLPRRGGVRAERLIGHPRFRAAYDFVLLREESGEDLEGLGDWWTRYQDSDAQQRLEMASAIKEPGSSRTRRRRPRKPKNSAKNVD